MLGSSLTLPFPAGDVVLPLINQDQYSSEYYLRTSLISYRLNVRHSTFVKSGVTYDRHNVSITKKTFATSTVPEFENTFSVTFTCLPGDLSVSLQNAVCGWLVTSADVKAASNANVVKLLGWES